MGLMVLPRWWTHRGFHLVLCYPFSWLSWQRQNFPCSFVTFFNRGSHSPSLCPSPSLVRNTLGRKITRSCFILKWSRFKHIHGMTSSSQEIAGEERGNICSLGWSRARGVRAQTPIPPWLCLQWGMGHRTPTFPHGSHSLGAGIVYRTASVPPRAAAALQHIPRGWRFQGKVMAGTEHPLLQRWECGINDSDRSNCTTAQKQKKYINPVCSY